MAEIDNIMKNYLESNFRIYSSIEDRKVKCLVIYRTSNEDKLRSKGGEQIREPLKNGVWFLRNIAFREIPNYIESNYEKLYGMKEVPVVIDETNYKGQVDVDIRFGGALHVLKEDLAYYGLGIKEEERTVKCLVIKEI